MQQRETHGFAS